MLSLYDLRVEYRNNPIGIDAEAPRISWKLRSDRQNVAQRSYRIRVTHGDGVMWDSGIVESDQSVCVRYAGEALRPQAEYEVVVSVIDNYGESACVQGGFETGLMSYQNMAADWITHGFADGLEAPAVFTKRFSARGDIVRARLYASALGVYRFTVNGKEGSDVRFAPGWTSYQARVQYQTYDVTELLGRENELVFTVGNGWYKGILGFFNSGEHYGKRTALIAQLDIDYADSTSERIVSDASWGSTTGPIRYSEIYHGEVIDYTVGEQEARPAVKYDQSKAVLVAQGSEPVRITERIAAQELLITPEGDRVLDFGQNLTGVIELKIRQPRGTVITVRHAEALDERGNFFTRNLRTARCTDTFVCSGGDDVFLPDFTYHGFRYIAVSGLEEIRPEQFTACVIHTDLEKSGSFSCSDERVNRLMHNVDWGLRDNFLDIPTDCPQRDERLGYSGDARSSCLRPCSAAMWRFSSRSGCRT
nr:family 78 glycoside hydrolase catalytic domain [Actinomyces ruminis]